MRLRLRDERGATSVVVALLMVPLLGFGAISVDVAASYSQELQLQNGADAAAHAIARDCVLDPSQCTATKRTPTAQEMTNANRGVDAATATVTFPTSTSVKVRTTGVRNHWFAPVLGHDSSNIATESTATWEAPTEGIPELPLAISWCAFTLQTVGGMLPTGTISRTIHFTESPALPGSTSVSSCNAPTGYRPLGGFDWLKVNSGTCRARGPVKVGDVVWSNHYDNNNEGGDYRRPRSCSTSDVAKIQDKTILLPIWDAHGTSSGYRFYRVYGFAAFRVTGYYFGGSYAWNKPCGNGGVSGSSSNSRCISGYFTKHVGEFKGFTTGPSAPKLGACRVRQTR